MRNPALRTLKVYLQAANTWLLKTPDRALDEAYEAAIAIKTIEDNHFDGNRIAAGYGKYGESTQTYFQEELKKYLKIIKVRLIEFRASKSVVQISSRPITEIQLNEDSTELSKINVIDQSSNTLRKLRFIDEVVARYNPEKPPASSVIVVSETAKANSKKSVDTPKIQEQFTRINSTLNQNNTSRNNLSRADSSSDDIESIVDKTGVLPRSILKTVDRIKRELDPNAEEEVVENFRNSKARTIIALRLVLLLIIVPLLTQQVAKITLVGPIVDHFRSIEESEVFLNSEMEEEALDELQRYSERLEFQSLIGQIPALNEEEKKIHLKEKAKEIKSEFAEQSNDAIKNVFADICSVFAFILLILSSKREIVVLKSFIDELIYGLSDSAKAFIIILLTDTFVGFHSPHGWEVLLEGISRHLGLPANRDFIFLFIATFPVILDTIFKYWIFRYLNRISPSAVATYRNMNE
jgi:hypothetical protein